MDNLKCRLAARIVAIIDLIILSVVPVVTISLEIFFGDAIFDKVFSQREKNDAHNVFYRNETLTPSSLKFLVMNIGIAHIDFYIFVIIGLVAAVMLLKATKQGASYVNAAKNARAWRNVNIFFFILYFLKLVNGSLLTIFGVIGGLVFEGVLIAIVSNFIEELDQLIAKQSDINLETV